MALSREQELLSNNQGSSAVEFEQLDFNPNSKDDPMFRKMGFDLALLHQEYLEYLETGGAPESFESSNPLMSVRDGRVVMDFVAAENTDALLADLEALGLDEASAFGSTVSGVMSIEMLGDMVDMEHLKFARAAMAQTNVGSTTSQGDEVMKADIARDIFEVDGSGVTVGILSDSYDNLDGESDDIHSGDIPGPGNPLGNTTPVNVLQELPPEDPRFPGNDEGRGIAQLIHDVAPGAALAFHTASGGQANFASGIIELAEAGSDVIVDDVIYFAEPMFQDGIVAQAVDQVVADGVSYFSSAGNGRRNSYESEFNDSGQGVPIFGGTFHDFDPGAGVDVFQSVTIPEGSTLNISFQRISPFFSVSGGAGSPNDLDIFLYDSTGTNVLAAGADNNIGVVPTEQWRSLQATAITLSFPS